MGTPPSTGGPGRVGKRVGNVDGLCGVVAGGRFVVLVGGAVGNGDGVVVAAVVVFVVVAVVVFVVVAGLVFVTTAVVAAVVVAAVVGTVLVVGITIFPFHVSTTDGHGSSP